MLKEINKRIGDVLEHSKMNNSEFANELEVPRSSISHILSGRNKPSLDFVIKVKNQFPELSWDWLINGTGDMFESATSNSPSKTPKNVPTENNTESSVSNSPDLFSMITSDNFGKQINNESNIDDDLNDEHDKENFNSSENEITDSQPNQSKEKKLKRIILFFDNGSFESYEQ